MSTRGSYGFYKDGVSKLTYNHFDSYPSGLGQNVLNFIKCTDDKSLENICDSIQLVEDDNYPSAAELLTLKKLGYGTEYRDEALKWFEIIGPHTGDLSAYSNGLIFMLNHNDFIKNSLFCEWAYIINLDSQELEIYEGFQKEPNNNRYSINVPSKSGYYSCRLLMSIPLNVAREINDLEEYIEKETT